MRPEAQRDNASRSRISRSDQISLPGLPRDVPFDAFTFGTLGLRPILSGFILVELVAVLVPGLRPLRASAEGRLRLRRGAFGVALMIAVMQSYAFVRYASAVGLVGQPSLFRPGADPRFLIGGSLIAGVLVVMVLAKLIDVAGVGVGYSVLIAAWFGSALASSVYRAGQEADEEQLLRFLLVLAVFAVASWRMLQTPPYQGGRAQYRLPAPGLEPVHQGVALAVLAMQSNLARSFFWPWVPGWLEDPATPDDRAALARATRASTFWLVGLTVAGWVVSDGATAAGRTGGLDAFVLVALTAVAIDLGLELRARQRSGCQRAVRVVHRLEDADALFDALNAAGIQATLRGARHRALYQFFAPFIPVGVLVAESALEHAEVVAVEHERSRAAPPTL